MQRQPSAGSAIQSLCGSLRTVPTRLSSDDDAAGQVSAAPTRAWLQQVDHWGSQYRASDRGFGLLVLQDYGWIDLGFRLVQAYWGKGLATEAASAWVHVAFDELNFDRLTALVHPDNAPSIRVLAKLGFRVERRDSIMGMRSIVFSLDAKAARAAADSRGA